MIKKHQINENEKRYFQRQYYGKIKKESGLLSFSSENELMKTYHYLEHQIQLKEREFLCQFEYLDDERLNAVEEELGYDDEQPLKDFESYFNFNSLRKKIEYQENIWLENLDIDFSVTSPDDHFVVDEVFRTLINENCEIKIGQTIYIFREGGTIKILDGNFETLNKIRRVQHIGDVADEDDDNIEVDTDDTNSCNTRSFVRSANFAVGSDKRIRCVLSIWTFPWSTCGPIAKTKAYKMKSNGGWKKYRTNLYARVSGKMVNPESCSEYTVFADKSKRAKKVKTARVGPLCQTKSGLIKSFHSGAGVSHEKTLTW